MQIKLIPDAKCCVIATTIKKDDVLLLKEHKPQALKKVDSETGDEIFAINYREGASSWTKFGVTFGSVNADGCLTVNATVDGEDEEKLKDAVVHNLMGISEYLIEFETSVAAEASAIREQQQTLRDTIVTV